MKSSVTDPFLILDELTTAQLERIDPATAMPASGNFCPLAQALNILVIVPRDAIDRMKVEKNSLGRTGRKVAIMMDWWDAGRWSKKRLTAKRQRLRAAIDQRLAARRGRE